MTAFLIISALLLIFPIGSDSLKCFECSTVVSSEPPTTVDPHIFNYVPTNNLQCNSSNLNGIIGTVDCNSFCITQYYRITSTNVTGFLETAIVRSCADRFLKGGKFWSSAAQTQCYASQNYTDITQSITGMGFLCKGDLCNVHQWNRLLSKPNNGTMCPNPCQSNCPLCIGQGSCSFYADHYSYFCGNQPPNTTAGPLLTTTITTTKASDHIYLMPILFLVSLINI